MGVGYLFEDDEAGRVAVGRVPLSGRHGGEHVIAYFRGGEWVSADTRGTEHYRHLELESGLTETGDRAAALDAGWIRVSVYGQGGGLGGHADTMLMEGRALGRPLAERIAGQLLDLGYAGYGHRVEAWGDDFFFEDSLAVLLSRG